MCMWLVVVKTWTNLTDDAGNIAGCSGRRLTTCLLFHFQLVGKFIFLVNYAVMNLRKTWS